jgi:predicted aldo/keto reductase-like oxidoreductase
MKVIALDVRQRSQLEAGRRIDTQEDRELMKHFLQKGLTVEQAKIKMVLADERISSACVGMTRGTNLVANVKAVLDGTKLTRADVAVLKEYAEATRSDYCAGCAYICDPVLPEAPYVSDIMRYLMYCNSYHDKNKARELFAQIPREVRSRLLRVDYSVAEARCPQALPIARLVAEAVSKLA